MTGEDRTYYGFLSGNVLKIAACALMFVDHLGMIVFPQIRILRIIGRFSMPLFAFMFAEGCYYTRNKLRHFLLVFILGLCTSTVASIAQERIFGDILITFSFSAVIIFALDAVKRNAALKEPKGIALSSAALAAAVGLAVAVCCFSGAHIDYGIAGVMLPVTLHLIDFRGYGFGETLSALYNHVTALLCFSIGLIALTLELGGIQVYCIFTLIPLAMYSGRRGRLKMKYFFYIFYPAHFIVIAAIYLILHPGYLDMIINSIFG